MALGLCVYRVRCHPIHFQIDWFEIHWRGAAVQPEFGIQVQLGISPDASLRDGKIGHFQHELDGKYLALHRSVEIHRIEFHQTDWLDCIRWPGDGTLERILAAISPIPSSEMDESKFWNWNFVEKMQFYSLAWNLIEFQRFKWWISGIWCHLRREREREREKKPSAGRCDDLLWIDRFNCHRLAIFENLKKELCWKYWYWLVIAGLSIIYVCLNWISWLWTRSVKSGRSNVW